MTAADALLAAVGQARGPMAHGVAAQPDYGVAAQDGRPVDANEQGWVQLLLQLGDRPIDQPAALSHVEPLIVALRGDPVDIAGGDPDQAVMFGTPELLDLSRRPLRPPPRPPAARPPGPHPPAAHGAGHARHTH